MCKTDVEAGRLAALQRYEILDTQSEPEFDLITELLRSIYAAPMAAMTLIDADRQWLKSHPGIESNVTPRHDAFCNCTIQSNQVLQVVDASTDRRFRDNPYVVGPPHIRSYLGAPLTTPDGYNIGSICVMDTIPRDYTQVDRDVLVNLARLTVAQLELRLMATEDPQTTAATRRAFLSILRRAMERARGGGQVSSLVTFNLDRFRDINETHGHDFGDVVLSTVARTIRGAIRRGDHLGRLGGEAFGVFLEGASLEAAVQAAERLRLAIEDSRFPGHPEVRVTASFGVAPVSAQHSSAEAWVAAADRLLKIAKVAGRNRCVAPDGAHKVIAFRPTERIH
ncbi:sensor domain-containing diguanylate cyclase [Cereibacter sphaeroides]|uniref:sensor domain-containing diguanylate cyclase n=1 Tax=Cereibacter sphaeroides TaxID=1063 RepID=UPI001F39F3C4|nr:sensor domain-containing diguanylate cyclase [Cereibacter sphaeroides]MCE6950952.1 sensor domain-containing diguanylate cyclase [Cereibacter sphaeroides]